MKSPEDRKRASERLLRQASIPIHDGLPLVEPEPDTRLRTRRELCDRLISLWAVAGTAFERDNDYYRTYVRKFRLEANLSPRERAFLLEGARDERNYVQFSWRLEAIYFLAWRGGLIDNIEVPTKESTVEGIMHLFPFEMEPPTRFEKALNLRRVSEVLDWADLLYRSHWAVRDARLNGGICPGGLVGGAIQEWHQAVNWFTHYGDEDNWDLVGTDT